MMKLTTQSGRSMVEMLGVLAIVGVLSVGAIAGYSKAMFKYKMNKTMDIVSHAINRIAELNTMNLSGESISGAQDIKDYGIMPDCDVNYTSIIDQYGGCPLPLGELRATYSKWVSEWNVVVYFTQNLVDSCVAFLMSDIFNSIPEDWLSITVMGEEMGKGIYDRDNSRINKELTPGYILDLCTQFCDDASYCSIDWDIES